MTHVLAHLRVAEDGLLRSEGRHLRNASLLGNVHALALTLVERARAALSRLLVDRGRLGARVPEDGAS